MRAMAGEKGSTGWGSHSPCAAGRDFFPQIEQRCPAFGQRSSQISSTALFEGGKKMTPVSTYGINRGRHRGSGANERRLRYIRPPRQARLLPVHPSKEFRSGGT